MAAHTSRNPHAGALDAHHEQHVEKTLDWVMFAFVLLTIPAFYLQLAGDSIALQRLGSVLYLLVFAVFACDLAWMARRGSRRPGLWRGHWLDGLIAAGSALSALGSYGNWSTPEWVVRALFVGIVLARILMSLRILFSPHGVVYVLGLGVATMAFAGAGFYWLEPSVHTYADGLWLAFESGATVGYGDIIPTTPASRLFAVFMVLLGYAVMSMVTAAIAAAFIGEDEKTLRREMHRDVKRLSEEIAALRNEVRALREGGPDKTER